MMLAFLSVLQTLRTSAHSRAARQIKQAVWTATVTYRHEEAIRIISVRRARNDEKAQYLDAPERRR
jgi:uncharacterized DUF497 family protein